MNNNDTFFCDVSRLGKIRLSGESAPEFVRIMTTVEYWRVNLPGFAGPALILNSEGDILDLVMIARTGEHEFMLITNPNTAEELTEWLTAHASLKDPEGAAVFSDLKVEDRTEPIAAIALYGLKAQMILDELTRTDVSVGLGDKNLDLITIGELQLLLFRWPLLRAHGQDMPLNPVGDVFEVYMPAQASEDFKELLLGYEEIDPETFEEYRKKRREAHTWLSAAEEAAYIKPTTAELRALLRSGNDFVGAKALEELGISKHQANTQR